MIAVVIVMMVVETDDGGHDDVGGGNRGDDNGEIMRCLCEWHETWSKKGNRRTGASGGNGDCGCCRDPGDGDSGDARSYCDDPDCGD